MEVVLVEPDVGVLELSVVVVGLVNVVLPLTVRVGLLVSVGLEDVSVLVLKVGLKVEVGDVSVLVLKVGLKVEVGDVSVLVLKVGLMVLVDVDVVVVGLVVAVNVGAV